MIYILKQKRLCVLIVLIFTFVFSNQAKMKQKICSIIIDGHLVGGYSDGRWLSSKQILPRLLDRELYKVYSLKGIMAESIGSKSDRDEQEDNYIKLSHPSCQNGDYIAISCSWNAMPRQVKLLNNQNDIYKRIVREVLIESGIREKVPIEINQLIKTDIEGDGDEEVIIAANYHQNPYASYNNDYSILLLRKIIKGKVENKVIEKEIVVTREEYIASPPVSYSVKSLIDADGDGILEIVMGTQYYEGHGYGIYQWKDGKMNLCLEKVYGE